MKPECDPPRKKSLKKTIETQRHILHTKTRSVSAHLGKAVSLQMNPHVLHVDGCCIASAAAVCVIFVCVVCANSKHLLRLTAAGRQCLVPQCRVQLARSPPRRCRLQKTMLYVYSPRVGPEPVLGNEQACSSCNENGENGGNGDNGADIKR